MSDDLAQLAPAPSAPVGYTADEDDEEFGPYSLKEGRQIRALKAFVRSGKVKAACEAAGVKYATWYRWINEEPEFRRAANAARRMLVGELEDEGIARAKDGSDVLIKFFLEAWDERYKSKQTIVVVSPEVQNRLKLQAEAIFDLCKQHLDPDTATFFGSAIVTRLSEIWE